MFQRNERKLKQNDNFLPMIWTLKKMELRESRTKYVEYFVNWDL